MFCSTVWFSSKHCTQRFRFAFMPASATAATVSAGKKYMSEKLVVPPASISRMARRVPAAISSGTSLSSMGKTLSNSHS